VVPVPEQPVSASATSGCAGSIACSLATRVLNTVTGGNELGPWVPYQGTEPGSTPISTSLEDLVLNNVLAAARIVIKTVGPNSAPHATKL
jgi:hypothetical protein